MNTNLQIENDTACFLLKDVPPSLQDAVRELDVTPHDLDLVVDVDSAACLNDLLLDVLVEPPQPSPGWIWDSFSRAFWHTRLEWVSGVNAAADRPEVADFGPTAVRRAEMIRWQEYDIKVPPLDLQYQVSVRRGLADRAAKIKEYLP